MTNRNEPPPTANPNASMAGHSLPRHVRWPLAAGGLVLLCALAVAAWESPDQRGYGTHEHLGLGPCTFRLLFNRPCPSCGMTTSWCCVMHGQAICAVRANAGGALLAMLSLAAAPWMLASAILDRWIVKPPSSGWVALGAGAVAVVTVVQWGLRLTHLL